MNEPIAIIGMGCRFPGGVNSPETFWRLLQNGVDAITPMPAGRFDTEAYYDATPAKPGKIVTREGGFLQDIASFDAAFFNISGYEAQHVDPQQRLLLEVAWEALEDAAQSADRLKGSRTGVFMGMWTNDYEDLMFGATKNIDLYITTGGGRYAASGRLSYVFDFRGPSMTVDTACSSSLVTVLLACQSIWNGESAMAVAGGVNLIIEPQISIGYSRSGMLSPDGRCKFGDAGANGYVRSEGVGVVVLKPLSDAQRDGDPIHALIRGGAVNNDGRGSGLLVAPSSDVQAVMLREAYQMAGVDPGQVGYIEAHGTGTRVGDPVEIRALGEVLSQNRPPDQRCMLGSVKTNIGHTEAASGVAGLIKAALCLKHRAIPASLHFKEPNPNIPWADLPFVMQREYGPWPEQAGPAFAGINSFGVTGTNAHIVLQEAPAPATRPAVPRRSVYLVPISARAPEARRELAQAYQTAAGEINLHDLSYTASVRRAHHEHRLAAVAHSPEELIDQLQAFERGETRGGLVVSPENRPAARKIVFVFPGQGAQWVGMGRQLLEQEPVFRATLERCETAMRPYVAWSLLDQLCADDARLDEIDVIQPLLFAVQVALAAVWQAWGVQPDAVIGHSMGEVAAAYVAGSISLDDAARVICRRSQLMKRVSGQGAMAMVELSLDEAQAALAGYEDRLSVAVSNSPRASVLSGDPAALAAVVENLQSRDVFCRPVKVDVAAHSPHMDALRPELVRDLSALQANPAATVMYSTVTGERLDGAAFDAAYWGRNLREPVRFSDAVGQAVDDGYNTFIEISSHPVLLPAIERGLRDYGLDDETAAEVAVLASMKREDDERAVLLESLAGLYARGYAVDWSRLYPEGGLPVRLPSYPWQREVYWAESAPLSAEGQRARSVGGHPLLGQHWQSAVHNGARFWETEIDLQTLPYLADHRVNGSAMLPAAAFVEMALAAGQAVGAGGVEQMTLHEALLLNEQDTRTVQVIVSPLNTESAKFQCFSRPVGEAAGAWTLHASGVLRQGEAVPVEAAALAVLQTRLPDVTAGAAHYAAMARRNLQYGPVFQSVGRLWLADDRREALAELTLAESVPAEEYQVHPALLDAGFQLLVALLPPGDATYLPVKVDAVRLYHRPVMDAPLWAYTARLAETDDTAEGDVFLLDEQGAVVLAARLYLQRVATTGADDVSRWLYAVNWQEKPLRGGVLPPNNQPGRWLVLTDGSVLGAELAERLEARGETCVFVGPGDTYQAIDTRQCVVNAANADDFHRLVAEYKLSDCRSVLYLWGAETYPEAVPNVAHAVSLGALHVVQALAQAGAVPRLWLVTQGTQPVAGEVEGMAQAPLWGLGAVIANEHAELRPTRIDLSADLSNADVDALFRELWLNDGEDQIVLRGAARYVARLAHAAPEVRVPEMREVTAREQPFCVDIPAPGVLDNLQLRAVEQRAPGAGEVEIEVRAAGLNFLDVMKALGMYPGLDPAAPVVMGAECAGVVVAVGAGVTEFAPGDEVTAITPAFNRVSLFAAYAVVPAALAAHKPAHLTFEQAATLPITFLTAYYALHHLGRLAEGERVLIHAAAGGVGLAALQLARQAGAVVYATAGSSEKREYLRGLGVEHIMDSRSLTFADEIMALTNGAGVDLVLNSLAGDAIAASLSVLAPYGRFLEIGKRDIYQNHALGLEPFKRNLSFFAIDLARAVEERPQLMAELFQAVMNLADAGRIQPLPVTPFGMGNVVEAFRHMAQARHIGKIVLTVDEQPTTVTFAPDSPVRADGTYLITGGLGGLGLTVARWLIERGARHLVLTGRRGASEAAQAAVRELEAAGAVVQVATADAADYDTMAEIFTSIDETLPPLRGIVHAAGLLDDSLLMQMGAAQFQRVLSPKVDGAWNLHTLTQDKPLDFFVLFSSVTALLGTPGQGNYAAANAYMDTLAQYRRMQGQPALSINWGPWSDVGLAAAQANRGDRLAARGLGSLSPEQGLRALEYLLARQTPAQMGVMVFDAGQWAQTYSAAAQSSLLSAFVQAEVAAQPVSGDIRHSLTAAEPGRPRRSLLENYIREQVAQVLRIAPARIGLQQPLRDLGIDSLLTLELRNRLESGLKLTLSATLVFNYPTVAALTGHLAEKLNLPLDATTAPAAPAAPETSATEELADLSRDAVEALLAEELDALDDLLKGI